MRWSTSASIILAATNLMSTQTAQAKPAPQARPAVAWIFDIHHDQDGNPHGKVFLRVNGSPILVSPRAAADYSVVTRSEYSVHHVPTNALAACSGWWAGGGEEIYVMRRRRRLDVFQRYTDEQSDAPAYRRVKTIVIP